MHTKICHCEKELTEKTEQLVSKQEEAQAVENELNNRIKDVENVKKLLEALPYKDGQMEILQKVSLIFSAVSLR